MSEAPVENTIALLPATSTAERTVFVQKSTEPVFHGEGQTNFTCPHCGNILAEHIEHWQIQNCVVECACGRSSEFVPAPLAPPGIQPTRWHAATIYVKEPITVRRDRMHIGYAPDR